MQIPDKKSDSLFPSGKYPNLIRTLLITCFSMCCNPDNFTATPHARRLPISQIKRHCGEHTDSRENQKKCIAHIVRNGKKHGKICQPAKDICVRAEDYSECIKSARKVCFYKLLK